MDREFMEGMFKKLMGGDEPEKGEKLCDLSSEEIAEQEMAIIANQRLNDLKSELIEKSNVWWSKVRLNHGLCKGKAMEYDGITYDNGAIYGVNRFKKDKN